MQPFNTSAGPHSCLITITPEVDEIRSSNADCCLIAAFSQEQQERQSLPRVSTVLVPFPQLTRTNYSHTRDFSRCSAAAFFHPGFYAGPLLLHARAK